MIEYDMINTPIVDVVNRIILYAAQNGASDIHFDPREDALMIRMRVDGHLINHARIPKMYAKNLTTRVKLISKMNITETRLPQDGAIKGLINGKDLDMRVACLPTNEGEKVVIRLLDYSSSLEGLASLGFSEKNLAKIDRMLDITSGIILVTGATGSGKSTTTYSMLQSLNEEDVNIITVEDPVEMNIEGINQVQVNSEIGLTFAASLRSILREDPDVILIGEIRDNETAQIAVRAAITGHLVLSTIHTNNSLATIERLMDMDVERYLLSTALNGIISQKLTRTLCPHCKKLRPATLYERHIIKKIIGKSVRQLYDAVGCPKCNRGFKGRMALHEVLLITDHLRDMLNIDDLDREELRKHVYDEDTTTLLQDALEKVVEGHTTFKEVYKEVDIDVDLEKKIKTEVVKEKEDIARFDNVEVIDVFANKASQKKINLKLLDPSQITSVTYDINISDEPHMPTRRRKQDEEDIIDIFAEQEDKKSKKDKEDKEDKEE